MKIRSKKKYISLNNLELYLRKISKVFIQIVYMGLDKR